MTYLNLPILSVRESMRSYQADLIRLVACLAVIMSHFFILTDFHSTAFDGFAMWSQGVGASFLVGSDLYMILTGFLCCYRSFSSNGYQGWRKVVFSYLIMSLLMIFIHWYSLPTSVTIIKGLKGILSFTTIPYAWYIEMWIGLFLLSPLLNILFHACGERRKKKLMILILFLICCPAEFTNRYGLYILPEYWCDFYPVCLYMIGCYIRKYGNNLTYFHILLLTIGILLILILCPTLNLVLSTDTYKHFLGDRGGIFYLPLSVMVFMFLLNIPFNISIKVKNILAYLSRYSFDIFLASAMVDSIIYPWLKSFSLTQEELGWLLPVIVIVIYILSLVLALTKDMIIKIIYYGYRYLLGCILKKESILDFFLENR